MFPEIDLCGFFNSGGILPVVHLVQVDREDRFLIIAERHERRQQDLFCLPSDAPVKAFLR